VASFSSALRKIDDAISETGRLKRQARSEGHTTLERKLRSLESDLEDLKRDIRRIRNDVE
jgi:hypothetical protein